MPCSTVQASERKKFTYCAVSPKPSWRARGLKKVGILHIAYRLTTKNYRFSGLVALVPSM
jgi:hypothetical protein